MRPNLLYYPLAIIYSLVTTIRNLAFDLGILKEKIYNIPIIGVGNLSAGGTGKTPHTAYIAKLLNSHHIKNTIVSRGYGRKTKGIYSANENSTSSVIGDEPMELYLCLQKTTIIVSEKRINGINQALIQDKSGTIILDDNFQHRYVKPLLQIILTKFDEPFFNDHHLPAGMLRENKNGAKRAHIVIVTKCPELISDEIKASYIKNINQYTKASIFFSRYNYGNLIPLYNNQNNQLYKFKDVILMTGIANTKEIENYISKQFHIIDKYIYKDHYWYTENDLNTIQYKHQEDFKNGTVIITTAKDATRLREKHLIPAISKLPIYILPIEVEIIHQRELFDQLIINAAGLGKF